MTVFVIYSSFLISSLRFSAGKPKNKDGRPPVIEAYHPERYAAEGQTVKLICRVKGHPRPFLLWYRDNELLRTGPDTRYFTLGLILAYHNLYLT